MTKTVIFKTIVVVVACVVAFIVVGVIIGNLLSLAAGGEHFVHPDDEPIDLLPTSEMVAAVVAAVGVTFMGVSLFVIFFKRRHERAGSGGSFFSN